MRTLRAGFRLWIILMLILSMFVFVLLTSFGLQILASLRLETKGSHSVKLRIVQRHLQGMVRVSGMQIRTRAPMMWPQEPFLLIANHISYWDIVAIGSLHPIGFMAKSEIRNWPLVGYMGRCLKTLFVERDTGSGRLKALLALRQSLVEFPVCVFPEGTTTSSPWPQWENWYRGQIAVAQKPGVKILAMGLVYVGPAKYPWVDDDSLLPHLWNCLQEKSFELWLNLEELSTHFPANTSLSVLAKSAHQKTVDLCRNF